MVEPETKNACILSRVMEDHDRAEWWIREREGEHMGQLTPKPGEQIYCRPNLVLRNLYKNDVFKFHFYNWK